MSGRVHFDVRDRGALPSRLRRFVGLRGLSVEGGDLEAEHVVAIIGKREASPLLVEATKWIAAKCVEAQWVVVSGGAVGIDAAAHEGAMLAGGVTWAVLPGGADNVFPPERGLLYDRIAPAGGALVWPFPRESEIERWHFHFRNRVVAALADAIIIVECPHKSGTKNTAYWARRARKPIWVVPAVPWGDCGGNRDEIGLGGRPLYRMDDFFRSFDPNAQVELPFACTAPDSTTDPVVGAHEQQVLDCLGDELKHPDEIVFQTGLSFAVVSRALLTLSLDTVVVVGPDGRYRRCH